MYQPTLPVTGAAGAAYVANGGPLWLTLGAFAIVAAGTALARIVPRRVAVR